MNKSLCLLVDDYPSEGRPVFVFVEQLVSTLVDLGNTISVIAPQSITRSLVRRIPLLPYFSVYTTPKGATYKVYRPYSISFGNNRFLGRISAKINQININKALKIIQPDILYGHFWHSAYKLKDYALKKTKPLFVACGEGDNALEELMEDMTPKQKNDLTHAVKGVISVSSENKRKCLAYKLSTEDNTIVLPNCVDDTIFRPLDASGTKEKLGIAKEDFTIVFTGHFITRKGSLRLASAIQKLNDSSIKSIFIGKALEGDDCTPSCGGIVYRGVLDHQDLPEYLNCGDVFVLPTLKEGCSNAIVEALACGIPVISSDRPFNDDILSSRNSILVDPDSVDEIADAIRFMKQDKAAYHRLKEYTQKNAGNYSLVNRTIKILDFIQSKL